MTEISRNLYFPHFRLFSNFCPFVIFSSKWYMQNILCINSNLPLTKGGLIKYEKGIRTISVHFERFWLLSWYLLFPKNTLHLQQLNDISIQIGRNCVQIPERHAIDERVINHEKGITTFLVHLKTFWLLSCYILEGSKNTFHKLGWIVFKFLKGMLLTIEGL